MQIQTFTAGNENDILTCTFLPVCRAVLHEERCLAFTSTDLGSVDF